jgi:hypothetical protein
MGEDGKPIFDPFVRYGPNVVVVPKKLSNEEWVAKYGHLAAEWKRNRAAPTARKDSPPTVSSAAGQREEAPASPGSEKAKGSTGVRRRSRFRP